ncbi:leishmanolysin family protein, putative [Ichthyophthirius multifiliis]|uniref:Leishmanolysin family protein, putative n=1 Tax=Ichthyophthirius multifiliis TaxID=5932 RepID=G0QQ11_ICHMU|nr:leishmanolysin family protein, putative [Ichthyophthirius multifiliis]EGR32693.1 leishmanolysin family protein, putative [Ichthyophthirius multifiliis]|eukprot:XP_004036679.1 leishmanolysin family protein, putative [Ichthyophthirius multifiliis]
MEKIYPYKIISSNDDYTDFRNLEPKMSLPKSEKQMRFNSDLDKCGEVTIPKIDRDKGKDSDLHIYAQYLNNKQLSFVAFASNCQFVYRVGPSHGQITFNLGQLEEKDLSQKYIFQDILEIIIHEMTHVLGFTQHSIPLWIQSDKSSYAEPTFRQTLRGIDTLFLKTPHVLQFARKYFNCPSLAGVPLENLGGPGSVNSHWKNTSYFSGFTANALRDTGFYEEIKESMEEEMFYGKGAGCQHVTGQCDSNRNEFCIPSIEKDFCDFSHIGASNCIAGQFNEPNQCWNIQNMKHSEQPEQVYGIQYGVDSKCFNSSLIKDEFYVENPRIQGLCYKYNCSSNGQQVTIHVGKQKVVCKKNFEHMRVKEYDGHIVCPKNIEQFCKFKKICPNFCSSNGYCLQNKCVCSKGYFGNDCSLKNPL